MGDALAMSLLRRKGFKPEDFAAVHPGGKLGRRLRLVSDLMHTGSAIPRVAPETPLPEVITVMTSGRLGVAVVIDGGGKLAGVITDGDLRRILQGHLPHRGAESDILSLDAASCMTRRPRTLEPAAMASEALHLMEAHKITSIVVVDGESCPLGVVHLHDLWRMELI